MDALDRLDAGREALEGGRLDRAARLLRAGVPGPFEPERRHLRGEVRRAQGLLGGAVREFREALKGDDPEMWVESVLGLAACLRSLGRAKEAAPLLKKAEIKVKKFRLHRLNEDIKLEQALLLRADGAWIPALRALKMLRKGSSDSRRAYIDWALGGAYRFQGMLSQAVKAFCASRDGFRKAGDRLGEGYAEAGLAGACRVQARFQDSIRHYCRAGVLFTGTGDLFGLAYANCGRANGLRQNGQWKKAEEYYKKALKLYRKLEDPADLAYVEWGLGQVLVRTERIQQGRRWLELSRKRFASAGEDRGESLAELALAAVDHILGRTRQAEKHYERGRRIAAKASLHTHLEIFT